MSTKLQSIAACLILTVCAADNPIVAAVVLLVAAGCVVASYMEIEI